MAPHASPTRDPVSSSRAEPAAPARARSAPALCGFDGEIAHARVRTRRSGVVFAELYGVPAHARLGRPGDAIRLDIEAERDGWHFVGWVDPRDDDGLRSAHAFWLTEGVGLGRGAPMRVIDAREGEVLVSLRLDPTRDRVRLLAPVERWIACAELALDLGGANGLEQDRRDLGLPATPTELRLDRAAQLPLSATRGSDPFAEIVPGDYPPRIYVVEEAGDDRRVVHHARGGVLVAGWVPAAALTPTREPDPGGALYGALADLTEAHERCTSTERLVLQATTETAAEQVGWIEAGTPFVRVNERRDGVLEIRPLATEPMRPSEGVVWTVRPHDAVSCERVTPPRMGVADAAPSADVVLSATVVQSDLQDAPPGAACEVELTYPTRSGSRCQARVRCGHRIVYGTRSTGGEFPCEVDTSAAELSVAGSDAETSRVSGDPALALDTRQRSLILTDDESGPRGAFRLSARIEPMTAQ
jgi:hypothetical protein